MKTFEERLQLATSEWVRDGMITDAQRVTILARHPPRSGGTSRFVGIVATLGGVLFAVGVSLVIKSNWNAIAPWVKIGGLVALLLGSYFAGWELKVVRRRFENTGDAALMVGGILFFCGIALVSQIFHLDSRPANGVLLWWAGIMLVPWLTRARGAQFLSVVAGLTWFGMEMTTHGSWIEVGVKSSGYGHSDILLVAVYFFLGLAVWFAGLALRETRWSEFAAMHEKWGLLIACSSLYWLGFARHHWLGAWPSSAGLSPSTYVGFAVAVALSAVAAAAAWRHSRVEMKSLAPWVAVTLIPVAGVAFVGPLGDNGWLWSGLAWLTLFVLSVAIVRVGLESGREGWVNLGILLIAANIITRYFDLFGSLLEGGVFFIVTGVLVTALGIYLEKKRRALVASVRAEGQK